MEKIDLEKSFDVISLNSDRVWVKKTGEEKRVFKITNEREIKKIKLAKKYLEKFGDEINI
jgi:hypothetical protein